MKPSDFTLHVVSGQPRTHELYVSPLFEAGMVGTIS